MVPLRQDRPLGNLTIAGILLDGTFAPIPAVRGTAIEPPESPYNGRSLRLTLSICLPLLFEIQ